MFSVTSARVPRAGLLALLACVPALAAAPYAGRPVQEVLRELGGGGVSFVYNTDIVPPALTVRTEPAAGAPAEIAREILAAHGLVLLEVGANAFAVVRGEPGGTAGGRDRVAETEAAAGAARTEIASMVVTTSRYALAYEEPQAHTFLTQADVESLPKFADEPLRSVQRLPGAAASGISAQSHIRGGEFDEVLMVLDGLPLDEPFHLKNFLTPMTIFDARAIESMDVYSGGFTAEYGDALSGIIDITTLTPPAERYTELGLSLFHANALSAGEFAGDRGQWLGSVRRSNLDIIAELADSDVGKPEYFDAFGRVSYALTEATTVFASALTTRDEIDANTSDETERSDATYRNTYVWGGWRQDWRAYLSSRLILALTDIDNDRAGSVDEPGQRTGSVTDRRTLRTGVARLDLEHRAPSVFTRFGVEGREVKARYNYASTVTFEPDYPLPGDSGSTVSRDLDPQPDGHQFGAYVTSRARLADRLSVEVGLRWDNQTYDDVEGSEQFAPRLNLMYDVTPESRLRAAWGRFWQAQGVNELQVEDGVDTFYEPQRADHLIISLEQVLPRDLDLRIEAYQKDYDRVRPHYENLFDPVRLLPELEPDRVLVAPSQSRARGVELLVSRRAADPWSWWFGYAWSRVTDHIDGADVVRSWDQRHTVNAGLRYAGPRWEMTLTDSYHTGWPTTDLILVGDPAGGPDQVVVGPRNDDRYRSYNSLDFRVMRRFDLPDSTLEAFFEVTNALVQRNPCCTEYEVSAPGGVPVIDRDLDYWPRIIPSFGVLWTF
jgi:outer membrane receptor protein involved in Fe transport